MQPVLILWTCANDQEAKTIVHGLLQAQKIACANIIYPVTSVYLWKGSVEEGSEAKVFVKAFAHHYEAIKSYIQKHGSYEVPEVSMISFNAVNPDYLDWMQGIIEGSV